MAEDTNPNMHHVTLHKAKKEKKPFHKRVWVWIIAALILIGIGTSIGSGNNTPTTTVSASNTSSSGSSKSSTNSSSAASTPGLNQPADDGDFAFTVTSLQCNVNQVQSPDDSDLVSTSGAPYCVMDLTVKNIKTSAQSFDDDSQYIYANGKQFSLDDDATTTLEPESSTFADFPTINPGQSMSGQLVFDIPSGVTPAYATLHDSEMSGGVRVNL